MEAYGTFNSKQPLRLCSYTFISHYMIYSLHDIPLFVRVKDPADIDAIGRVKILYYSSTRATMLHWNIQDFRAL